MQKHISTLTKKRQTTVYAVSWLMMDDLAIAPVLNQHCITEAEYSTSWQGHVRIDPDASMMLSSLEAAETRLRLIVETDHRLETQNKKVHQLMEWCKTRPPLNDGSRTLTPIFVHKKQKCQITCGTGNEQLERLASFQN